MVTRGITYANHFRESKTYRVEVQVGLTTPIDLWFDLAEPVHKAFEKTAIVRVHYLVGGNEEIALATLAGGSLKE